MNRKHLSIKHILSRHKYYIKLHRYYSAIRWNGFSEDFPMFPYHYYLLYSEEELRQLRRIEIQNLREKIKEL